MNNEENEIRELEKALREAQMKSDVEVLDRLIADDLIFTGLEGKLYSKEDDLGIHRSGLQTISHFEVKDMQFRVQDAAAVVILAAELEGTFMNQEFKGLFRYTRIWLKRNGKWQIAVGHLSTINQ